MNEECLRRAGREHLWAEAPPPAKREKSDTRRAWEVDPPDSMVSVFARVTPNVGECAGEADEGACRSTRAVARASKGNAKGAARLCAAVPEGSHRDDCFFLAAEQSVRGNPIDRWPQGAELCLAAGEYRQRCFAHLSLIAADMAPEADASTREWTQQRRFAWVTGEWWKERAPDLAPRFIDRFWSQAAMRSMDKARDTTGDLLEALDEQWHPHVRSAAAWRLVGTEGAAAHDLRAWTALVSEALARRARPDALPRLAPRSPTGGILDLWPPRDGEELKETAICYLGTSRRALAKSAEADVAVAVLEAAGRQEGAAVDALLEEARLHGDATVRWTARRIAERRKAAAKAPPPPPPDAGP